MISHNKIKRNAIDVICLLYILLFVYAAASKMLDFENFQIQLGQSPLISAFASWVAPAVLALEFLTALLLMIPKFRMAALFLALSLMSLFTVYIFIILNYSSFVPCSCGGILEKMSWTSHLIFNMIFVLLAGLGIVLHHNTERAYKSRKKTFSVLLKMIFTVGSSAVMIIILFLCSERIMHFENPFIRRYPQHPAMFENQLDLKYNSYYFAGQSDGRIYLGNYTAPLHLKSADARLRSLKAEKIVCDAKGIPFQKPIVSAEYIKYLFKTVRKFFGEAVVVTQEVEDIISSPIVKQAIINNSDCKILLDQSKYQNKFDQIQELLGLTEKEKALVLSVNKANDPNKKYKEVFISLGGMLSKVYRTEVSLEEYLAYTTEESEKVKMNAYAEKFGGDIKKGIAAMAQDMRDGKQLNEKEK